eukprot:363940-Chlamydomonas_euryale.AAC.16
MSLCMHLWETAGWNGTCSGARWGSRGRRACFACMLECGGVGDAAWSMHAQVLMHAQLRDNNQGIVKITSGGLNRREPWASCGCVSFPGGEQAANPRACRFRTVACARCMPPWAVHQHGCDNHVRTMQQDAVQRLGDDASPRHVCCCCSHLPAAAILPRRAPNAGPPIIEQDTNLSAVINGNNGTGMLVLKQVGRVAGTMLLCAQVPSTPPPPPSSQRPFCFVPCTAPLPSPPTPLRPPPAPQRSHVIARPPVHDCVTRLWTWRLTGPRAPASASSAQTTPPQAPARLDTLRSCLPSAGLSASCWRSRPNSSRRMAQRRCAAMCPRRSRWSGGREQDGADHVRRGAAGERRNMVLRLVQHEDRAWRRLVWHDLVWHGVTCHTTYEHKSILRAPLVLGWEAVALGPTLPRPTHAMRV